MAISQRCPNKPDISLEKMKNEPAML